MGKKFSPLKEGVDFFVIVVPEVAFAHKIHTSDMKV
jgi:hypothetical protein